MSESKHTPGPWKWHWRPEDKDAPGSVFAEPYEGHAYAVAMMPRYQTKEQWEADARLISAAPDLLDALTELNKYIDFSVPCGDGDFNVSDVSGLNAAFQLACAAIEKAEGKS